jgi:hypothetical protein
MKATFTLVLYLLVDACANAQAHQGDPKLTEIWSPVPRVINRRPGFSQSKKAGYFVPCFLLTIA